MRMHVFRPVAVLLLILGATMLLSCSDDPETVRWRDVETMVRDASADSTLHEGARAHADSAVAMLARARVARSAGQALEALRWRERAAVEAGLALVAGEAVPGAPAAAERDSSQAGL